MKIVLSLAAAASNCPGMDLTDRHYHHTRENEQRASREIPYFPDKLIVVIIFGYGCPPLPITPQVHMFYTPKLIVLWR